MNVAAEYQQQMHGVELKAEPDSRVRPRISPGNQLAFGFAAEAASVSEAREETGRALLAWRIPGVTDDTISVVSELVTNAVVHTAGPQIELVLTYGDGLLLVEVRDESTRPPVLVRSAGDGEGGRGLQLVHALSSDWGWLPLDQNHKAVWALMAVRRAELTVTT
ncbi:ATP-binding protein [Streptomyces sp. NPDC021093]|uniref:ATP-binding protein n=1 Tax=Streptomyces sp. NPDC021093 TaxID=3365112 RepID=UPI00379E67AA